MSRGQAKESAARTLGRVVAVSDLASSAHDEMFSLLETYFTDADRAVFELDLASKHSVVLLESESGQVVGFSAVVSHVVAGAHDESLVVYSGDTIVDEAHRGSLKLLQLVTRTVMGIAAASELPSYWMLLSSGYRTYRLLPLIFRDFFPRAGGSDDADLAPLARAFAEGLFGERYHAGSGVVFVDGASALRSDGDAGKRAQTDPHIRFFIQANPEHTAGGELVCLARLRIENFTGAGIRLLGAQ